MCWYGYGRSRSSSRARRRAGVAGALIAPSWRSRGSRESHRLCRGRRGDPLRGRGQAPASWPVYRLVRHPGMCVRLDRRAVYLALPPPTSAAPPTRSGAGGRSCSNRGPRLAAARASAAPGGASLPAAASCPSVAPFTGLGFDACATPSSRTMSAWSASPYRALGRLHRRGQPRLRPAQPDAELGGDRGGGRLAPDPPLRRPAGADQQLRRLRQAQLSQATRQGTEAADGRGRRGRQRRDRRGQPDLLRHGGLHARTAAPAAQPSASLRPGRRGCTRWATSPASTAAATRDRRPGERNRHRLQRARRRLDGELERSGKQRLTPISPAAPGPTPAAAPVPRRS